MLFRVVDIETVPDLSVWTPGLLKLTPKLTAQGSYHPSWELEEPFPPPQAHRVVAIAWCDIEMKFGSQRIGKTAQSATTKTYELVGCHSKAVWSGLPDDDERLLVGTFGKVMHSCPATIVSWNGRTFDLPVLSMRALKLGIPWGWYYKDKGIRYRYTDDGHTDLMDTLSDYGAARQMKLGDAARCIGLPGKTDMDGSKVAEIVARGADADAELRIARYCLQDVAQTALLFIRSRYHLGIINAEDYANSIATFEQSPLIKAAIDIDWRKLALISSPPTTGSAL